MTGSAGSSNEHRPRHRSRCRRAVVSTAFVLLSVAPGADTPARPQEPAGEASSLPATPAPKSFEDLVRQGNEARKAGRLREAIVAYRQARDLSPRTFEIHVLLADTLRRAGEASRAMPEYDTARRLDPKRPEGHTGMALILRSRYEFDAAAAILQDGLGQVAPESRPDLMLVLAETRRRQKRLDDAGRLFGEILALRARDAPAQAGLARVAEDRGDLAGAIGAWDRYLEIKPDDGAATERRQELRELRASIEALRETAVRSPDVGVLVELGRLQSVAGDAKGSAESYRRALKADPDHAGARRGLALALRDSGSDLAPESAREFRRLLKQVPGDGVALYGLAALAGGGGAARELEAWRDLVAARPDDLVALRGYLVVLERQGSEALAGAAERTRAVAKRRQSNPARMRQQALLLATAGRASEAADLLYHLLLLDPTDPWSLDVANEILFLDPSLLQKLADSLRKDMEEAAAAGGRTMATDANSGAARQVLLARLTLWAGRGEEALNLLRRAVIEHPDSVWAHSALGEALQDIAHQPGPAIAELQKTLDLDPGRPAAHVDLALAYLRAGRPKQAEAAARRCLERNPHLAPALSILGAALADQEDFEGAASAYAASLSSDPADNFGLARGQLPVALAALGRNIEARRALRGSLHTDPEILYREAWAFVRDSSRDRGFNGQDWLAWRTRYREALKTEEDAYRAVTSMLSSLGDPYTRLRDPEETSALFLTRRGGTVVTDAFGRVSVNSKTVITGELPGGLGYIRLSNFTDPNVVAEVRAALEQMRRKEGIVLDLRGNAGGLSRSADEIGDLLVGPGKEAGVDASGAGLVPQITGGDGALTDSPLTVLVDGQTGSAAERLARALSNTGRATLSGDPTMGKGRAQVSRVLPGGSTVLVSASEMLGPDGQPLQGRGLKPTRREKPPAPR